MVPVPVPVFIPVPMNMYSQHMPVPLPMPMPVPVPMMVPPQSKDTKDAAVQSEASFVKEESQKDETGADQSTSQSADRKAEVAAPSIPHYEKTQKEEEEQADLPLAQSSEKDPETAEAEPDMSKVTSDPAASCAEDQPPSSPMMDLESDFPPESLHQKPPAPRRGVKRPREGSSGRKRGRRRTVSLERRAAAAAVAMTPPVVSKLNHVYGVKAWRSWVQQHNKQPQKSDPVEVKEDVLQCDSAELSFGLSRFIKEVRRPNGEPYSPDSIFYLCLGIQQHLFMMGRIENIFTDQLYSQFASEISGMLRLWKPKLLTGGGVVSSRVEESYLWECKQLGAYSPIVLLNTLLFFCTKHFHFNTVEKHQRLSFSNFTRHSKPCSRAGKVYYLRFQRSGAGTSGSEDTDRLRRRQVETEGDLEMMENVTNPLHCAVRLYEFYLSRCPESVKKRTNVFYLQPEQNVHTNSPYWYTSQPLDATTLQSMLTRILAVREVQKEQEAAGRAPSSAAAKGEGLQ